MHPRGSLGVFAWFGRQSGPSGEEADAFWNDVDEQSHNRTAYVKFMMRQVAIDSYTSKRSGRFGMILEISNQP